MKSRYNLIIRLLTIAEIKILAYNKKEKTYEYRSLHKDKRAG